VPVGRIAVGGFSQGCIVRLLLGLGGRYAGRVGGVVGLSGALCSAGTIERAKEMMRTRCARKAV
jgi:predicted esterase